MKTSRPQIEADKHLHMLQQWLSDAKEQKIVGCQRLSYLLDIRRSLSTILSTSAKIPHSENTRDTINQLAELAGLLCDWPLLLLIDQQTAHQPPTAIDSAIALAETYQHIGRYDLAKHALTSSLIANPNDRQREYAWCQAHELIDSLCLSQEGDLWITPLSAQHLYDFAWQYNESIQALCNLPVFIDNDDWHYWLDDMQNDPYRKVFAIFHEEWGFIGSVSLQLYEGVGFFYYWLGDDFQGMGLGPRAVELLMQWGEQQGMTCCYAKIYADNIPSHKAIQKIGFQPLPFAAAAPHEHEVFYYRGANKPEHQLFQGLKYLLYAMNSDIQPLPNQQTIAA